MPPNNVHNVGALESLDINDYNANEDHRVKQAMPRCHARHQASGRRNDHQQTCSLLMDRLDETMMQGREVMALLYYPSGQYPDSMVVDRRAVEVAATRPTCPPNEYVCCLGHLGKVRCWPAPAGGAMHTWVAPQNGDPSYFCVIRSQWRNPTSSRLLGKASKHRYMDRDILVHGGKTTNRRTNIVFLLLCGALTWRSFGTSFA